MSHLAQGWIPLYSNQDPVLSRLPYFPFQLSNFRHLPAQRATPAPLVDICFAGFPFILPKAVSLQSPKLCFQPGPRALIKASQKSYSQAVPPEVGKGEAAGEESEHKQEIWPGPQDHVNKQWAIHMHLCDFHCCS